MNVYKYNPCNVIKPIDFDMDHWIPLFINGNWKRSYHFLYNGKTNVLLATFLLGIQRLEDQKILALAHQAMLEDMLEFWRLN